MGTRAAEESPKLLHPWQGPFRIVKFPFAMTVKLQTLFNKPLNTPIHVSRLKKYHTPERPTESLQFTEDDGKSDAPIDNNKSEAIPLDTIVPSKEFEVERILNKRKINNQVEY